MLRDPAVEALVAEIDQALVALQTARRLLADLQRSQRAISQARRSEAALTETTIPPSIRFTGMTVAEAAVALRVSEEHVRRMLRKGQLVGVGFGGSVGWRLSRQHVEEMAANLNQQEIAKRAARRRTRAASPRRSKD